MSELSSKTFVIVNPIFIDELLENYKLYKSIGYLRNQIKIIKGIGQTNFNQRQSANAKGEIIGYVGFVKVPYNILEYMYFSRSKAQILFLFYLLRRYWKKEHALIKIKDLERITGVSVYKYSRAVKVLMGKGAIKRIRLCSQVSHKHGHKYFLGRAFEVVPGKILATKIAHQKVK